MNGGTAAEHSNEMDIGLDTETDLVKPSIIFFSCPRLALVPLKKPFVQAGTYTRLIGIGDKVLEVERKSFFLVVLIVIASFT